MTLGTQLRQLIELLDGPLEASYRASGLDYRPRFTPVVRALVSLGEGSIGALAAAAGVTHSAISQTVAQMERAGLVTLRPGADARERLVTLAPLAREVLPVLERHWAATALAAAQLERELSTPLSAVLTEALGALERQGFGERIARAQAALAASAARPSKRRSPR
jgi:DNA-binding MarR family transcriptional regulator